MSRATAFATQATSANDQEFSAESLAEASANSFGRLLERFGQQSSVQRNSDTPVDEQADAAGTPLLYVSDVGFPSLFSDAASFTVLYGSATRAAGRDRPAEAVVDQAVFHSFGYRIDREALRAGARSIQVEAASGHNPYKVSARLQQVLSGASPVTSHVITRKGDIYSVLPWSRAPSANASRRYAEQQVESRSISIDLEALHTTSSIPFIGTNETTFRIVGIEPYTAAQYTAVAFLLKKLGLWSRSDVFSSLGFDPATVRPKLGNGDQHVPGVVNISAYAPAEQFSPGAEFDLPAGYKLGDALPSHLSANTAVAAAWQERFTRRYLSVGYAVGTDISALSALTSTAASIPNFSYETDLFRNMTSPPIVEITAPETTVTANNEAALASAGAGYARSQAMSSTQRAGLYEAAAIAQDALTTAAAEMEGRQLAAVTRQIVVPSVQSALCFDFSTGLWGYQQVVVRPDPSTVPLRNPLTPTPPNGGPNPTPIVH